MKKTWIAIVWGNDGVVDSTSSIPLGRTITICKKVYKSVLTKKQNKSQIL